MKNHDQLTIIRNRHRAGELRLFRDLVEKYFAQSERDTNDMLIDWDGAQAARSRINQMLPRIIQVVRAAGLGEPGLSTATTDPGPRLGRVEVLQRIFSARYQEGVDQEILDVIDMALGVYESERVTAFLRTINPLHYVATILAFVARGPRTLLRALGLRRGASEPRIRAADLARLERLASQVADAEDLIDSRLASLWDLQTQRHAEYARNLAELAERLDFAERVLARHPPANQLPPPPVESEIPTPV